MRGHRIPSEQLKVRNRFGFHPHAARTVRDRLDFEPPQGLEIQQIMDRTGGIELAPLTNPQPNVLVGADSARSRG